MRSCFSKRFSSLFQKAHGLRPGNHVAVMIQCPNGWEFKTSEPDSDIRSIVDTYLSSIDEDELDEFDEIHGCSETIQSSVFDCARTSAAVCEYPKIQSSNSNSQIGGGI